MYARPPPPAPPPPPSSTPTPTPAPSRAATATPSTTPAPVPSPTDYRPPFAYDDPAARLQLMPPPPPHHHHHQQQQQQQQHHRAPPYTPVSAPVASPYDAAAYYYSQPSGPYGQRQRRTTRAQQACDQCRARKAKCDEGRPSCGHCKESSVQCVYKDVPPHKHERSTQILLDRLQQIDDRFKDADLPADKLDRVLQLVAAQNEKLDALLGRAPAAAAAAAAADLKPAPADAVKQEHHHQHHQQAADLQVEPDDDELSIPIEHTTAAHKLLLWPSIQKLLPDRIDDDYVMKLEEARGPIRPYGRGEGTASARRASSHHHHHHHQQHPHHLAYPLSPVVSATSPRDDDLFHFCGAGWGTGLEIYRPDARARLPPDRQVGGRNSRGALDLDAAVVHACHQSYLDNMHILHPFLRAADLALSVRDFVHAYSPPPANPHASPDPPAAAAAAAAAATALHRAPKRKRSLELAPGYTHSAGSAAHAELASPGSDHSSTLLASAAACPPIQRSMDNAIVLLVLALGAICAWKSELPGPLPDPAAAAAAAAAKLPPYRSSAVSPVLADSALHVHHAAARSPNSTSTSTSNSNNTTNNTTHANASQQQQQQQQQHWRAGSADYADPSLRNMDVVPGMAYYALATDILGNLQGGNDLSHAQGCLLAALYTGQLAHPFASHGWISQAARACQVLVRARSFEVMPDGARKDLITFAFWTCLQLESDILAELDLPASGISRLEGRMEFPKAVFAHSIPNELEAPDTLMMMYYSAQIHLRKVLNRVHTNLYKTEKTSTGEKRTKWSTRIQELLNDMLESWRRGLPKAMKWDDCEPPARDINIARMRGKYYGARYIIHRPLLHHALHPIAPKALLATTAPAESPAPSVVSSCSNPHISPALAHVQQVDLATAAADHRWAADMPPPPPPRIASATGQDAAGPPPSSSSSSSQQQQQQQQQQTQPPQSPLPGTPSQDPPFEKDLDNKLHAACVTCIEAAMQSTIAFDNVEGRPIVTNIFGTAHAQFGNILVLAATYTSRFSNFVDRERLRQLIDRTIKFLLQARNISPSLLKDAHILTQIRYKLFDQQATNNSTNTNAAANHSFSSNDG
ncbi:hypothetical protein LOZ53_006733 [Ophidiomyces ophidiicola]|nr:hypothetical protein LOZ53_006733 [Ophidiomyces ophidiicola]